MNDFPNDGDRAFFDIPADVFSHGGDAASVINEALAAHGWARVPRMDEALILDRPIVLSSGARLSVHPETVLRVRPGRGGCMLRNAHLANGCDAPISSIQDHDILVEGGVWEGSKRDGLPDDPDPTLRRFLSRNFLVGALFFCGAERVEMRDLTVRGSEEYAILLACCSDFTVRGIRFVDQKKDGVHVNGPAERGLIEDIEGSCGDDIVALNAWDWNTSAVSFGPIRDITVKRVRCGRGEIRLLPGRKTYESGEQTACPVERCAFEDIEGVYTFKMYQQPNCHNAERGTLDRSDIPGDINDVTFDGIRLTDVTDEGFGEICPEGLFEMGADCHHIAISNVSLDFPSSVYWERGGALVSVGPKSSTWTRGFTDPARWSGLFEPDMICTAEDIRFENIRFSGQRCVDMAQLIRARRLSINPDYPRTRPRGGTGYGIVRGVSIDGMTK